jgi:cytochrome c oxidase subunit 2
MEKRRSILRMSLICILTALSPAMTFADTAPSSAPPLAVTASNYKFAPSMITVQVDQAVTLDLTSTEGVHGIQSSDLGIPATTIAPGRIKTVTFTPKKTGTFLVHCSVPCGPGHADMVLIVKVTS